MMPRSHFQGAVPRPSRAIGPVVRLVLAFAGSLAGFAAENPPAKMDGPAGAAVPPVSFHRQIRPILQANCVGCHQPAKARGGYVMTEFARMLVAGESTNAPVVAGLPDRSHLLAQITPATGKTTAEMPRNQPPLPAAEIGLIRRWITEGARDDSPANAQIPYDAAHPPRYIRPPVLTSLDFSPDGKLLAVAGLHEIILHHADGSGVVARLIGISDRIQSARFSPDGKLIAAAGGQPGRMGEVQIWDVEKRELRISVPVGFDTVYGVNWSPDGKLVSFGCSDKTVRAIEAATGKQVLHQMAHDNWVLDTVFSTNGTHVISVGRDQTTKLTEIATQRFVDNITSITPGALRGGLQAIARHPGKDEVLVGGADGQPQIFQVFRQAARKIGDNANLLRKFPEMAGRIFGVDYSPDGSVIAAGASLDGKGAVHIYSARFDSTIPAVLLKAYEKTSGEYTKEEREAIEKFTTGDIKQLHRIDSPTAPIYSVSFRPDGKKVAAGTGTGVVLLIDVESGQLDTVFTAAPFDDGETPAPLLVNATTPSAAAAAPEAILEVPPRNAQVTALAVSPDRIQLNSRNEKVQLLVTATLDSGATLDLTRVARFDATADKGFTMRISPRGVLGVSPAAGTDPGAKVEGHGTIKVEVAGRTVEVPVDLHTAHARFDADFVRDVNPVMAKLGCTAGTCHGAKDGKNGFKLSLRGYDPIFDVRAVADDHAARRVNFASPDESLMLLKATGAVAHEGGQRTTLEADPYAILRQWIVEGARYDAKSAKVTQIRILPENPVVQALGSRQQMRVIATYADGKTRDVTADAFLESGNTDVATVDSTALVTTQRRGEAPMLARYEGNYVATTVTVMGDRSGFVWQDPPIHNRIDELVAAKWQRMKILPSEVCSDAEFIRRVSLDLTGLPPGAKEVREFLSNPRDRRSRREALIERLMNSPDFADHWANKWADLLQVNRKFLGEEGARLFRDWIRKQVAANAPYDDFVRTILTASGSNKDNPAAAYWKILRDAPEAMENTTHLFLATRFNCNKCHDHPFERWTQDQYYNLAQFFSQVSLTKDDASGDRRIGGSAVEGSKPLFEVVGDRTDGGVKHDRTGKTPPPGFPFASSGNSPTNAPRRAQLANWLTSSDNRFFALSYVNRLWGYLLGVGLIEPLDDIRAGNPPSNPELLEHLTREFVESGFNTRHILRQICQSRTYQLALATHRWNADDTINFSHALPRRLPAEVLLDSVFRVTGSTPDFPGVQPGLRAAQLIDSAVDLPSGFLANLGRPPRESACECERSNDIKLSSVMALLSGPAVSDAIRDPDNALAALARTEPDDRRIADELFIRVLNRPPTEKERDTLTRLTEALEVEHGRSTEELAKAEAAWAVRRPRLETDRNTAVAKAEKALAEHLAGRAAPVAAAQRERLDRIAAAESAVADHEPRLQNLLREWEAGLGTNQHAAIWTPLDPKDLNVGGSARLQKLPDGSIRTTASIGELPTYTITAESMLPGITGVKLEVLPDAELPGFGPGHKDGDFILAELSVDTASRTNAAALSRVKIVAGDTDLIAPGFELAQVYNGVLEQGRKEGWTLGKETGRPHWAAFGFEKPVGDTNGTVLRFTLAHRYEAPHEIGRFRLWVTTSQRPTAAGLPADIAPILKTPAQKRSVPQIERLLAYLRTLDPEILERGFRLELARKALPEDEQQKEIERQLVRASRPVAVDPVLAQLRQDVEASARQLAQRRLTATQDLAWALINTPAFLFNR